MVFILVMDLPNSLLNKAGEIGLLSPLSCRNTAQRMSLYANDVAISMVLCKKDESHHSYFGKVG